MIGKNFEMQSRLFKNPNFPSLFMNWENLEIYIAPDQHFKIQMSNLWMSWENLCSNVRLKIKIQILVAAKRLWGHSKSMFTQNFNFSTSFYMHDAYELLNKKVRNGKRENNYFCFVNST